jgi:cytochrome c-type biogenesis protein CcmE
MISTRAKLIVALVVVVGTIGLLVKTAVTHASTFYVTVGEFYGQSASAMYQPTTVSGQIVGSSVHWNPQQSLLQFYIEDTKGGRHLPVVFSGAKPDDFTNDWPVIVTGKLQSNGTFKATQLLVKCPSKYNAQKSTTRTYTAKS